MTTLSGRCECKSCKRHKRARSIMERVNVEDAFFIAQLVNQLDATECELEWEKTRTLRENTAGGIDSED